MIKQKQKSMGTESTGEISNLFFNKWVRAHLAEMKTEKEDAKVIDRYEYRLRGKTWNPHVGSWMYIVRWP